MISVIGNRNTIMGFGLCGLEDLHEVDYSITEQELLELIETVESDTILIEQVLAQKIVLPQEKQFIIIPSDDIVQDDIDVLVAQSLGLSGE